MFVITSIIVGQVKDESLFDVVFKDTSTGQEYAADFWTVTQYIMVKNIYLSMLNIFAAIMDLVLFGFFCYHLYLVSLGQTTNESFKWASIKQVQSKLVSAYKKFVKQGSKEKEEICNPAKAEDSKAVSVIAGDIVGSSLITEAGAGTSLHDLSMKAVHGAVNIVDISKGVTLGNAQKDVNDSDGSDDAVGGGYVRVESLSVSKILDKSIQLSVSEVTVMDTKNTALEASDSAADEGAKALSGVPSTGLHADKITHLLSPPTRHPIRTFIDGTYSLPDVLEESPLPLPANIYNKGMFSGLR